MGKSVYTIQKDGNVYEVEANSEAEALAAVEADIAPGSGGATYAGSGQRATVGQERTLGAMGGIDPLLPEGSGRNPYWQAPGMAPPDTGVYIDPRGQTFQHDARPLSETYLATAGRMGARTLGLPVLQAANTADRIGAMLGGNQTPAPFTPESMFPSGANDALESGLASGVMLGGKNEFLAATDALQSDAPMKGTFLDSLAARDERDRVLRTNHPYSYYGGGAAGTGISGLLTPPVKGAQLAGDMAMGSIAGFLSTDGDMRDRAIGAGFGAAAGAGGRLLAGREPKAPVPPRKPTPQQVLLGEGVRITPGQAAGGFGRNAESALTSVPILGGGIKKAEQTAIEDLNRAAINRTLKPIGESLPSGVKVGHDAVAYAEDQISAAYDRALQPVTALPEDEAFRLALEETKQLVNELPGDIAAGISNIIENRIEKRLATGGGAIDGPTWKKIDAVLSSKVRTYSKAIDPIFHEGADVLDDVRGVMRDWLERGPPETAAKVREANQAFANLVRVQRAARRSPDGVFTPAQLDMAVKMADSSSRGRMASRGDALMQDLSSAGAQVMKSYPDSGTASRMMGNAGLVSAGANPLGTAAMAGALAVPRLAYSSGLASKVAGASVKADAGLRGVMRKAPRLTARQRALLAQGNARLGGLGVAGLNNR